MKSTAIKGIKTKSKGRFNTVTIGNKSGEQKFVGRIKKVGESYVTFDKYSGERGEVKYHVNSVSKIS